MLRRVEEEGKEAVEAVGDGLKTAASGVANGAKAGAGKVKGAAQDAAQDAAKVASHVANDVEEGLASLAFSRDKPVTCKARPFMHGHHAACSSSLVAAQPAGLTPFTALQSSMHPLMQAHGLTVVKHTHACAAAHAGLRG